jgi:hypothetical protein
VNHMWGRPARPPWGWIVSSPDQERDNLDAILRDAGGLQRLAVQLGQGDSHALEPAAANENVTRERTG